ncbi:hypothetical protein HNY73_000915 [Argiope bruennichi]|uniref:Uncharacterized protein n=1 Tax=Argiope bruennichi TaxID=94029 RepID=A0A8T0G221_ARGBR|nr:hypothetical protein HNY73_000915 [Argiope bruennichi]
MPFRELHEDAPPSRVRGNQPETPLSTTPQAPASLFIHSASPPVFACHGKKLAFTENLLTPPIFPTFSPPSEAVTRGTFTLYPSFPSVNRPPSPTPYLPLSGPSPCLTPLSQAYQYPLTLSTSSKPASI